MHVLMTTDTLGGVWVYTRELVTGLCRRGCKVTLVSLGKLPDPGMTRWLRALDVELLPTAFKLEWMDNAQEDTMAARQLIADMVRELHPDVVHTNQFAFANLTADTPTVLVAHSDVFSWWRTVYGERPPASNFYRWYEELVRDGLQRASAVIAPSRSSLQELRQSYGYSGPAAVILNGRSSVVFNPYAPKGNYALSVGRLWDSAKQVTLLSGGNMKMPVKIAGSTLHPVLGERSLPTAPDLEFMGELDDTRLAQVLARARVYVGTSRYEPFGLAPLEAAFSRCALLLNDIPSFREIWADSALYFERNDAADVARWLERLAADEELWRKCANAAYQRARALYSAPRMVDNYLDLYRSLIAEHKAKHAPGIAAVSGGSRTITPTSEAV